MEKRQYCPFLQKARQKNLKNYRPVSLLPICGKIFERLIFNERFSFLMTNNLLAPNQSGFGEGGGLPPHPPPSPRPREKRKNVKNRQDAGPPGLFTEQNLVFDVF